MTNQPAPEKCCPTCGSYNRDEKLHPYVDQCEKENRRHRCELVTCNDRWHSVLPVEPQPTNLATMSMNRDCPKCGWTAAGSDCPKEGAVYGAVPEPQEPHFPLCNCAAGQDAYLFCHGDECAYKKAVHRAAASQAENAELKAKTAESEARNTNISALSLERYHQIQDLIRERDQAREALRKALEWAANYPLQGEASNMDAMASEDVYQAATDALAAVPPSEDAKGEINGQKIEGTDNHSRNSGAVVDREPMAADSASASRVYEGTAIVSSEDPGRQAVENNSAACTIPTLASEDAPATPQLPKLILDPTMPPNQIDIQDHLGRREFITNIAAEPAAQPAGKEPKDKL